MRAQYTIYIQHCALRTSFDTCLLLISMLWHRQTIFKSKGEKLSFSAECCIWTRVFGTESPADWMPADKPTELSRIKLKTWTQQPVLMISEYSAHSTPLPFGFRTWLWRHIWGHPLIHAYSAVTWWHPWLRVYSTVPWGHSALRVYGTVPWGHNALHLDKAVSLRHSWLHANRSVPSGHPLLSVSRAVAWGHRWLHPCSIIAWGYPRLQVYSSVSWGHGASHVYGIIPLGYHFI